jgi:hypothetical protein
MRAASMVLDCTNFGASSLVWTYFQKYKCVVQAIVMPGGIWQEAIHGCWTQLELPMALLHAFGLSSKSLLHEAIVHAGKENMSEVVELIVAKNSSILSFRQAYMCCGRWRRGTASMRRLALMCFRLFFFCCQVVCTYISTLDSWCCQLCLIQMPTFLKPMGILPVCKGQHA